ncbi:spore germination protein GerPE [Paenibacillus sp. GD4]|jgi:spore germination protein PE|uniref:spore germination protein GerPE n=1 Tax=Paenibacillus TaxID=44249 RepID=UPI00254296EC|nr:MULTISPECIES: spore germination protein GerPE [Paenibacillus]MDQ1913060.1 spore germination protein GerPE [Paenibacillus sp. GD4]
MTYRKPRTSVVNEVKVIGVDSAGVLFVGDMKAFLPVNKALAVQRELPTFFGKEGAFSDYRTFTRPIPQVVPEDEVTMEVRDTNPFIKVNRVRVFSVTNSSLLQIGSLDIVRAEARVLNIRQLLKGKRPI